MGTYFCGCPSTNSLSITESRICCPSALCLSVKLAVMTAFPSSQMSGQVSDIFPGQVNRVVTCNRMNPCSFLPKLSRVLLLFHILFVSAITDGNGGIFHTEGVNSCFKQLRALFMVICHWILCLLMRNKRNIPKVSVGRRCGV